MKRIVKSRIICCLCAVLIVLLRVACAGAEDWTVSGDWEYTAWDETACLRKYLGHDADLVIPETIDGYTVTELGPEMAMCNQDLVSVTVPDTVTHMYMGVFQECEHLEQVRLSENLDGLYVNTFACCFALKEITVPASVELLEDCFVNSGLEKVTILGSSVVVTLDTFANCDDLREIILRDPEAKIYVDGSLGEVFLSNKKLTTDLTGNLLPLHQTCGDWRYDVKEDGTALLVRYTGVDAELVIPDTVDGYTVTEIGQSAVGYNGAINALVIPGTVETIGSYGIRSCENLSEVTLNEGLQTIGDHAFSDLPKLKEITIPSTVRSVGGFDDTGLEKVTIKGNRLEIWGWAFNECGSLREIVLEDPNVSLFSDRTRDQLFPDSPDLITDLSANLVIYTEYDETASAGKPLLTCGDWRYEAADDGTAILVGYTGSDAELVIPDTVDGYTVTGLGQAMAFGNLNIRSVWVPDTVTRIDYSAFADCRHLSEIRLSENLEEMRPELFRGAEELKIVTIPASVWRVGGLENSAIEKVIFQGDFFAIEVGTFEGCQALKEIVTENPRAVIYTAADQKTIFCDSPDLATDLSGNLLVSDYIPYNRPARSEYLKVLASLYGVEYGRDDLWQYTVYADDTVCLNRYLGQEKTVTVPSEISGRKVRALEAAFAFSGVEEVTVPAGVSEIGAGTFAYCSNLRAVRFENAELNLGEAAFYRCTALKQVLFPETLTSLVLGNACFMGCASLEGLELDRVRSVGRLAFFHSGIRKLTIRSLHRNAGVYYSSFYGAFAGLDDAGTELPEEFDRDDLSERADCFLSSAQILYDEKTEIVWAIHDETAEEQVDAWGNQGQIVTRYYDLVWCACGADAVEDSLERVEAENRAAQGKTRPFSQWTFTGSLFQEHDSLRDRISLKQTTARDGDYEYGFLSNGEAVLLGYTGNGGSLTLPAELDGHPLTGIAGQVFAEKNLQTVVLPESLRYIGSKAFSGNPLKEINFPDALEEIEWDAFQDLAFRLTLPGRFDSVRSTYTIYSGEDWDYFLTAEETAGLTACHQTIGKQLDIPEKVDGYRVTVLQGLTEDVYDADLPVTKVHLPDTLEEIGAYAFYPCKSLTGINLPAGLRVIGESAFRNCAGLKLKCEELPESLALIDDCAFYGSSVSGTVTMRANCVYGSNAFDGTQISALVTEEGVTTLPAAIFNGCKKLTKISLCSTLTEIDDFALEGTSAPKLVIPAAVTRIGQQSLNASKATKTIDFTQNYSVRFDGTPFYDVQMLVLPGSTAQQYAEAHKCSCKVVVPKEIVTAPAEPVLRAGLYTPEDLIFHLVIPEGVEEIADEAFLDMATLTDVKLPSTLKKIGDRAFSGCGGLTAVQFPKGLESIGASAFEDCRGLKAVKLPETLRSIGASCFSGCAGVTTLTFPKNMTEIPDGAFSQLTSLKTLKIPEGVTVIGKSAFSGCEALTSLTLPKSLKTVEEMAFLDATLKIKKLTIPAGTETIGAGAFGLGASTVLIAQYYKKTAGLIKELTIPSSVRILDDYAFSNQIMLKKVTFAKESALEKLGSAAFYNCSTLAALDLTPCTRLAEIGLAALTGTAKLKTLKLPEQEIVFGEDVLAESNEALQVVVIGGSSAERWLREAYPDIGLTVR